MSQFVLLALVVTAAAMVVACVACYRWGYDQGYSDAEVTLTLTVPEDCEVWLDGEQV